MDPDPDSRPELRVLVASKNPVKLGAARRGFERVFADHRIHIESISVPSGVPDQPTTDEETLRGARQRARNARAAEPDADFWVGMEGGLEHHGGELMAGAWIYILGPHGSGRSRTANFLLPPSVVEKIHAGMELGLAIDEVFDRRGAKRGPGAAGLLTDEVLGRTDLYEPSVILALAPLRKAELYTATPENACI